MIKVPKKLVDLPQGEKVVSMVKYNDTIVVATDKSVYLLSDNGVLKRIQFEID